MHSYLDQAKLWLRKSVRQNSAVQGEATMETLRRFRGIALVVLFISCFYIAASWHLSADNTAALHARHARAMINTHLLMSLSMLVLGLWAQRLYLRAQRLPGNEHNSSYQAIFLQILICISALAFAVSLAVIEQLVSANTTAFVLICLITGMLSLMRPALALPLFLLTYLVYFNVVALTQHNPDLLLTLRDSGRDVLIMSAVVSVIVWRQYVESTLLRREIVRTQQALAAKQVELTFLANHDPLTGLYNRREFFRLAKMELLRTRRDPSPTHIIILDIDHFKVINDNHGHPEGDLVLIKIADVLNTSVRETDVVARLGGEEFIILLPKTARDDAIAVAEKLRQLVKAISHHTQHSVLRISASFGVAGLDSEQVGTIDDLYLAADQALYQAKHRGRDQVSYATPTFVTAPSTFTRRLPPA